MGKARGKVLDIYARVSRLGDDRQRSTTGQVDDCTARVEERDATVGEVFVDSGRSAWNPRVKRKDWDKLMRRLEDGESDGVVVFDLARFSRRPIEGERLITAAERGLLVLDSEDEYDLTTASGKKAFRDQLNTAAYESDRLSTRVKRGKKLKASRGESNASWRAFGWEPDGTLREDEAALVRDLVTRVLAGETQDDLVVELNSRGIPTSTGKHWTRANLKQILTRPRNAGLAVYQGEVVGDLKGIEPIIEREVWDRVDALFASRRRGRPNSSVYLCSGLVFCGLCSHVLTGRPRANMKPYPDGGVRRGYWCQPRSYDGGCGRISVDQRELDKHVGVLVVKILADPRHAAAIEAANKPVREERQRLQTAIAECEELADELAGRLGRREITMSRYDIAMKPIDRDLAKYHAQLTALPDVSDDKVSAEMTAASLSEWTERWKAATVPEKRTLIRQALGSRRLIVNPAKPKAPRVFDPMRITIDRPIDGQSL
ncbi:recombinase family protein [Fodinicola acaciae]|uniref:recombinase family protein n=1 Tax=Fodinicola acaciae TaxID=2681555 RepID=UPI0013CF9205|nr:recombinase family protein [Fodinicola acaciae]